MQKEKRMNINGLPMNPAARNYTEGLFEKLFFYKWHCICRKINHVQDACGKVSPAVMR